MKMKEKFKATVALLLLFAVLSSSTACVSSTAAAYGKNETSVSSTKTSSKSKKLATSKKSTHKHSVKSWKVTEKATTKKAGSRTGTCTKCGKKVTQKISAVTSIKLKYTKRIYTGKKKGNPVTIKNKSGKTLKEDKDYTLTYKNNKSIGTAKVTIKFKGKYSGSVTKKYSIVPTTPKITSAKPGKAKITLKWEKCEKNVSGYKITYATNKNFKNAKSFKVGAKTTKTTINDLYGKRTYYVHIKAYKKVDGKRYYSLWSKYRKVTTKGNIFDITGCVQKSKRVSSSYFDDVVFVGDSISLGLNYYNASKNLLGKAKFLTAGSLGATSSLWKVTPNSVHPRYNGQKMKIEDAISQMKGVKKVYIMFGMNDIGLVSDSQAIENYKTLCANIKVKSPNVVFYVQSVTPRMKMTPESQRQDLTNERIVSYNKKLSAMCKEKGWYFINVATALCDGDGNLKEEYCGDPNAMGMHLMAAGFDKWVDYLYTHTA